MCTALSAGGTRKPNANVRVTRRSDFNAAGVRWKYRRNSTAETLSANGTLTQAANVEVLVGKDDSNVQFTYEYVGPKPTTQTPTTQQPTTKAPTTHPPTTPPTNTSNGCPGMLQYSKSNLSNANCIINALSLPMQIHVRTSSVSVVDFPQVLVHLQILSTTSSVTAAVHAPPPVRSPHLTASWCGH